MSRLYSLDGLPSKSILSLTWQIYVLARLIERSRSRSNPIVDIHIQQVHINPRSKSLARPSYIEEKKKRKLKQVMSVNHRQQTQHQKRKTEVYVNYKKYYCCLSSVLDA